MNKQKLYKLLEYSLAAYGYYQSCYEECKVITIDDKKSDVECFIRIKRNEIIITFRGSDSKTDALNDIYFCKSEIPYDTTNPKIKVHSGFLRGYKSEGIRDRLLSIVKENEKINNITLTGHSYGGALATLCALDMEYHYPEKHIEVAIFGSPRVGNSSFKKSYNRRVEMTYRVVNGNDIVTKLPFRFMGFSHIGTEIRIGFPNIPHFGSFKDHAGKEYTKNLWKKYTP